MNGFLKDLGLSTAPSVSVVEDDEVAEEEEEGEDEDDYDEEDEEEYDDDEEKEEEEPVPMAVPIRTNDKGPLVSMNFPSLYSHRHTHLFPLEENRSLHLAQCGTR